MKVSVVCPMCGKLVEANKSKKINFCPECETTYITSNALELLRDRSELEADQLMVKGRMHLTFNETEKAYDCFVKASALTPRDYRIWWEIYKLATLGLTRVNYFSTKNRVGEYNPEFHQAKILTNINKYASKWQMRLLKEESGFNPDFDEYEVWYQSYAGYYPKMDIDDRKKLLEKILSFPRLPDEVKEDVTFWLAEIEEKIKVEPIKKERDFDW